jgi:hypothetical protein
MSSMSAPQPPVLVVPPVPTLPPEPTMPPEPTLPPEPVAPPEPIPPPEPARGASGWILASGGAAVQAPGLAMHRPAEQQPSLQVFPAQQVSPRLPHLAQTPSALALVHAVPAWQAGAAPPAGQQAWPEPPQAVQVLLLQSKLS